MDDAHPLLQRAVEALAAAARQRLGRHPAGHLAPKRGELEVTVSVPLAADGLAAAATATTERLHAEVDRLLAHHAAFRPGRVYCRRCGDAECEHSAPTDSRHIFAGWGPSGAPRFVDFGQWLLERQHPGVEGLYRKPPALVAEVVSGQELVKDVLPAYKDGGTVRIHGQVVAGFFSLPSGNGGDAGQAVTLQVLSTPGRGAHRRLALNVVAAAPGGEPLAKLYGRLERLPWTPSVQWGQTVLASVERSQERADATPALLSGRISGMLTSIARRLAQDRRARDRRTEHAEERHNDGERPTRMAVADLGQAKDEELMVDTRRNTWIVLGERGRAHVFNRAGKLVTSLRVSADSLARRREREIWRPASTAEALALRDAVAAGNESVAAGD